MLLCWHMSVIVNIGVVGVMIFEFYKLNPWDYALRSATNRRNKTACLFWEKIK